MGGSCSEGVSSSARCIIGHRSKKGAYFGAHLETVEQNGRGISAGKASTSVGSNWTIAKSIGRHARGDRDHQSKATATTLAAEVSCTIPV